MMKPPVIYNNVLMKIVYHVQKVMIFVMSVEIDMKLFMMLVLQEENVLLILLIKNVNHAIKLLIQQNQYFHLLINVYFVQELIILIVQLINVGNNVKMGMDMIYKMIHALNVKFLM